MANLKKKVFNLRTFVILFCLAFLFGSFFTIFNNRPETPSNKDLELKKFEIISKRDSKSVTRLTVEVAKSIQEHALGLSNRSGLKTGFGMYFELSRRSFTTFWMKDMRFPIDIIWIDQGKIVGIEKNAPVPKDKNNLPNYSSPSEVTNVLEVDAGFTDKNGVKVGDQVKLN